MQNPFWHSAGPRFVDRNEVLELARGITARIVVRHALVTRILLFGSYARGDYGVRSDLDLLIILRESDLPMRERTELFVADAGTYPTDMLVYTEREVQARLEAGDAFLSRALKESLQLFPKCSESPPAERVASGGLPVGGVSCKKN